MSMNQALNPRSAAAKAGARAGKKSSAIIPAIVAREPALSPCGGAQTFLLPRCSQAQPIPA